MNDEELTRAMRDATAAFGGPSASFDWVATNGRRRLRRRRLSGLAAGVALLAASLGAVALADDGPPGRTVRATDRPSTANSSGRARQPGPTPPTVTFTVPGRPPPSAVPPSSKPWIPGPTRATVVPTTPRPTTHPPPIVDQTTIPPRTHPPTTSPPPEPPPPSRPVIRPAANGDVDGDGIVDRLRVVPIADHRAKVHATLSALGEQTVVVDRPGGPPVAVIGASDVDGDGFAEVFVRVGGGASSAQGSILRLVGGRLTLVRIALGAGETTSVFYVDGSLAWLFSFDCVLESDWVTLTEARPTDDTFEIYDVTFRTYRFLGSNLALVRTEVRRTPAAEVPQGMQPECGLPQNW